jgi:hypothetical protein
MQVGGNVQQIQQQMDERQNMFKELQAELDARNAAEAAAARVPAGAPISAPAFQDSVSIIPRQSRPVQGTHMGNIGEAVTLCGEEKCAHGMRVTHCVGQCTQNLLHIAELPEAARHG